MILIVEDFFLVHIYSVRNVLFYHKIFLPQNANRLISNYFYFLSFFHFTF